MTLFSSLPGAMILATCLAARLIEQPSINPLNIYTINNDDGHNNNDGKNNDHSTKTCNLLDFPIYNMLFCKDEQCFFLQEKGTINI